MSRRLPYFLALFFLGSMLLPTSSKADPLNNWHLRRMTPQGYTLYGVTYGNGIFVAVGGNGTILTSPDGILWTPRNSWTSHALNGVTYGNGIFVVVGDGPVLTSPDGILWTPNNLGKFSCSGTAVTYGNGVFVLLDGSFVIACASTDGITWTSQSLEGTYPLEGTYLLGVTYGNGIFVATGQLYGPFGYGNTGVFISTDGASWTPHSIGRLDNYYGVTYGNGTFVAVGGDVITSPNGIKWTPHDTPPLDSLNGVTYGNGIFVAVGEAGLRVSNSHVGDILTSTDGVSWTSRSSSGASALYGVTYGNNTFLAVGDNGTIVQSDVTTGSCTAMLSSSLSIHIPIINFSGTALWANLLCESGNNGNPMCRVTDYGEVNSTDFSSCQASTLSANGTLHIPDIVYNNISYHADFMYIPTPGPSDQIWFMLVGGSTN